MVEGSSSYRQSFRDWWSLSGGFFFTASGRIWLVLTLTLCVGHTLLNVYTATLTREYLTALTSKKEAEFWSALTRFGVYLVVCVPFYAAYDWVLKQFSVTWRSWMTNGLLDQYVRLHYPMSVMSERKLEAVESRIVDDCASLAELSSTMLDAVVGKVMALFGFAMMLWSISPTLVVVLVFYTALSSAISSGYFGRHLTRLQRLRQDLVSRLRFALISLRSQSEAIAFFRAESDERIVLGKRNEELLSLERHLAKSTFFFSLLQYAYQWTSSLVAPLVMAPRFFAGEVEYGAIAQAGRAFNECFTAFSVVVDNLSQLVSLAAAVHRLKELRDEFDRVEMLQQNPARRIRTVTSVESIGADNISIELPLSKKNAILSNLTFRFPEASEERGLLIVGHSGVGKTSLLRVFCGMWQQGEGLLYGPPREATLFLTQRLFLSALLNTLREQLTYALPGSNSSNDVHMDDRLMSECLTLCNLGQYANQLDVHREWHMLLSPGETQRLAFARMLIWIRRNEGKKLWVFLDEATSALDVENEKRMYENLAQHQNVRYVSVAHRDVSKYHQKRLRVVDQDQVFFEDIKK